MSFRQIGRTIGCHPNVVSRVIKRWEEEGALERKEGSGRPRKTSPQTDRFIMRSIMANSFVSVTDLKETKALAHLSENTILRRISESGEFKSYWALYHI